MLARLCILSAAAFVAFGMTAPASAQSYGHRSPQYGHRPPPPAWYRHNRRPPGYRPWVYAPPPVFAAPPVYYAPPPPVYYAPAPGLNFSFAIP